MSDHSSSNNFDLHVLLHVEPEKLAAVIALLRVIPGIAVHAFSQNGQVRVTITDTPTHRAFDTLVELHNLHGVIATTLIQGLSES